MRESKKRMLNLQLAKKFKYLRSKGPENMANAIGVILQTRRFTKYDLPKLTKSRSSRFHHLKPELWRISRSRPTYSYLHDIALERLQQDMIKRLSIVYDLHICKHGLPSEDTFPHRLYSWDFKDFLNRRKLDTVWVDVLKVQMDRDCFSTRKFKTDLDELRRYLRLIFTFYAENHANPKLKDKLFKYFEETINLLEYEDDYYTELKVNRKKLADATLKFINFTNNPNKNRKNFAYKVFLEDKYMNADVFNPVEMRYQMRYYDSREKEFETKCETAEEKLQAEIAHYQHLVKLEECSSVWLMTFYNNEIESFKDRVNMLSTTYDIEFDKIDNKINYYKIHLDKIKEQRKFLTEQLNRFREELEIVRERDMAYHEELLNRARKREQSEAAKLAKALKKASKLANKKGKQRQPSAK